MQILFVHLHTREISFVSHVFTHEYFLRFSTFFVLITDAVNLVEKECVAIQRILDHVDCSQPKY